MVNEAQKSGWEKNGFFIEKQLFSVDEMKRLNAELVASVREDPPENHRDADGELETYTSASMLVALEKKGMPHARGPEDHVSKIFSAHKDPGLTQDFMRAPRILGPVTTLLGTDAAAIIQSQFIFKNPGAWGQPWHQDSYYFKFDQQPQIGVWIASSPARIENGCLFVAPGSHREDIHKHHPASRAQSNYGYTEITDRDFSDEIPVLLETGDCLFFHSYLMHKSVDNNSDTRRTALVYHYARPGTRNLNPKTGIIVDIQPVIPL